MTADRRLKTFNTRFDRFRADHGIAISRWLTEAGITRTHFARVRRGRNIAVATLVELVRSANRILKRPVRASELVDLGEDEPVNTGNPEPWRNVMKSNRRMYETRFDRALVREGIVPARLAREAKVSRQLLRRLRAEVENPRIRTIRKVVRAMRRMGRDIHASDIFDVGEDE